MQNRQVARWTAATLIFAYGCATSGAGCGGCVEPIPGGFPLERRTNGAVTAKVSAAALRFVETRVNDIVGAIAAEGLNVQVPCIDQTQNFDVPLIGTVTIPVFACDHNESLSCVEENGKTDANGNVTQQPTVFPGPRDEQKPLNPKLKACQVKGSIKTLKLNPTQASPTSPVVVNVELAVRLNTGTIPVFGDVPICDPIRCIAEFDSDTAMPADIPFKVPLTLAIDPNYGDILSFNVGDINVTDVIDASDLLLRREDGICSFACDILNVDFVKTFVLNFAKSFINKAIQNTIDGFRCRACEVGTRNCPSNSTCKFKAGSDPNTDPGFCTINGRYNADSEHAADRQCPPRILGLEGRVGVGAFLSSYGAPNNALLDLYAVAGGKNPNGESTTRAESNGIVIAIMGGTRPAIRRPDGIVTTDNAVAVCVPPRTWQERAQPNPISFDTEADAASPAPPTVGLRNYQIGLALSDNFIDRSLFDSYQAGLLCLNVDSTVSTFLSSGLFRTFLPSLGVLTQGQDVPMLIALRPKQAPTMVIGKGTVKTVNGELVPDDPLMTIKMTEVQIDFYGLIEGRYSRLFSLKTDITLPLSLKFKIDPITQASTVQPVLANLEDIAQNITATNSEMLSENPQIVADLLNAVIGLVQPILAGVLAPVELPTFNGFKLLVRDARGAVKYGSPAPGYEHLALFADLQLASSPLVMQADTDAALVDGFVPRKEDLSGTLHLRPHAVIDVKGRGLVHRGFGGYEYTWRVDAGLWSPFTTRERIEVSSPVLVLPGRHNIEFMAREIGLAATEDMTPVAVPFLVDYDAPEVKLELDAETREIRTVATDAVAREDELSFRYRAAGADWSSAGGVQAFRLEDLGLNPALEVEVTDPSGHVGHATFGDTGDDAAGSGGDKGAAGCNQAAGSLVALLVAAAIRRRRT